MKGLKGLIRVHKWRLEEERKTLAHLLDMRESFIRSIESIRAEMAKEREVVKDWTFAFAYAPYVKGVLARIDALTLSVAETDAAIDQAEERVADAYREFRKYEIALEARLKREAEEAERRDRIALDEIALNQHRRLKAR
jgi:flagellar biosynthesis chaperone FliJ